MSAPHENNDPGVQFQVFDGKRSSQLIGTRVFAEAVAAVDPALSARIEAEPNWRKNYLAPVREVVEAGARSPKNALRIAADGLRAAHESFVFNDGNDQVPLLEALRQRADVPFGSAVVRGEGSRRTELAIPYRGKELRGDDLLRQLDAWENAGIIEPSCASAVRLVATNPQWLDMTGVRIVLLGAASEMGPLEWLSRWGAEVIAVDLPRRDLWERIIRVAKAGAGTLHAPVAGTAPAGDGVVDAAGADLLMQTPALAQWLSSFDGPLIVGNYAYADGSTFLRLAAALDSLTLSLQETRNDVAISYLATPTDAFAVPQEIVQAARDRRGRLSPLSAATRTATANRVFAANYSHMVDGEDGRSWGIADALVPQQGPNYALAKMVQRWRATVSREEGHLTSANVAPATLTRSVVKNRVLAAAYRGASAFGIEIFGGSTSRALMSALLVHDLRNPEAPANPDVGLEHPYDLFTHGAAHGGLWRLPYEPRTVLPLAVGLGLLKRY